MPDRLAAKRAETAVPCLVEEALPAFFKKLDAWQKAFGSPLLIAISGGGDSMALCRMTSLWAQARGTSAHAVSIDHGLRPSSADEAAQAMDWATALGLTGEVIRLEAKPAHGGLQEWARQARYQALAKAAARNGAKLILVGHTWDDQVETLCWRLARSTGLDGLAGMSELAVNSYAPHETPNLLGRPLLELKRADLRAWLVKSNQAWLEDESNQNLDFARIRTRKLLGEMAAQGVEIDRIIRLATLADALRKEQEQASLALLERCGLLPLDSGWHLNATLFWQAEPVIVARALGWLIYSLTEAEHPPESQKIVRVCASLMANPTRGKTLGGVWMAQKGPHLFVKIAPVRRSLDAVPSPTPRSQYARLFAVSRQPHEFVTQ